MRAIIVAIGVAACAVAACGGEDRDPIAAVAEWNEARNEGDIDRSMSFVADDARLFWYSMADDAERAEWLEVLDAQRAARWTIEESCSVRDVDWVTCDYVQSDELLRRWGLTLRGTHDYTVRDGLIVTVDRRHDPESEREVYEALDAFREWVAATHPDLVPIIWSDSGAVAFTDRRGAEAAIALLDDYPGVRHAAG